MSERPVLHDLVVFVHNPKTAGMSFSNALERALGNGVVVRNGPLPGAIVDDPIPADATAVRGQIPYGVHELVQGRRVAYVTILRDPVDRVVSSYYHILEQPEHQWHRVMHDERVSLARYVAEFEFDNAQTRLLSGRMTGPLGPDDLEAAKRNLDRGFAVVGVVDAFDEFCVLCKMTLGWKRWPYYRRTNVGRERASVSEIPRTDVDLIRSHNQLDAELFRSAARIFEEQKRRAGPSLAWQLLRFRAGLRIYALLPAVHELFDVLVRAGRRTRRMATVVTRRSKRSVRRTVGRAKRTRRRARRLIRAAGRRLTRSSAWPQRARGRHEGWNRLRPMAQRTVPHDLILFVHNPKAAGTTFFRALRRLFGRDGVAILNREQAEGLADNPIRPEVRVIRGQLPYGVHELIEGREVAYVTILREPVDRVVSSYYHILEEPTHALHRKLVDEQIQLEDYGDVEPDNFQTRLISGQFGGPIGREHLEIAKRNLRDRFAVVGVTGGFDEFCVLCKVTLGWRRWPYYRRSNVSKHRVPLSAVPPEALERIRERNELDAELFQTAVEVFEDHKARLGDDFQDQLRRFRLGQRVYPLVPQAQEITRRSRRWRRRTSRRASRVKGKARRLARRGLRKVRTGVVGLSQPQPAASGEASLVGFVHVHKAAGTTLTAALERLYGTEAVHVHKELEGPDAIARAVGPTTQVVRAPYLLGIHDHVDRPVRYITVLRPPIERVVSAYFYYCRRHGIEPTTDDLEAEDGLFRFVAEDREPLLTDNGQTRVIGGCWGAAPGALAPDSLDRARNNLGLFTAVGVLDRLDEFLVVCRAKIGWKRLPLHQRVNVGAYDAPPETLPPEVVRVIEEHNRLDSELYPLAVDRLDADVASLGARFERDLAVFQAGQRAFEERLAKAERSGA